MLLKDKLALPVLSDQQSRTQKICQFTIRKSRTFSQHKGRKRIKSTIEKVALLNDYWNNHVFISDLAEYLIICSGRTEQRFSWTWNLWRCTCRVGDRASTFHWRMTAQLSLPVNTVYLPPLCRLCPSYCAWTDLRDSLHSSSIPHYPVVCIMFSGCKILKAEPPSNSATTKSRAVL